MLQDSLAQTPVSGIAARRVDLDWVRIAAFGLLILYHVGMLYVSWGFHIKSDHRIVALEPLMLVLNPWRLGLLFLVSGAATRFMMGKLTPAGLVRSRSSRLLPPLIFGMLVVVPPQAYEQVVESLGYREGFVPFYLDHYFAFGSQFCRPGPCLILPTWNHLWFVVYLWVYTMALGAVLLVAPRLVERAGQATAALSAGVALLAVPPVILASYRLALLPQFPSSHALFGDWYNHALYGSLFLFGFLVARADAVWTAMSRLRWHALALAAAAFACFLLLRRLPAPVGTAPWVGSGLAYGCYQWCAIVVVLGFARRWLNRDSAVRRYLTDAVFPYYIVHQTAIILIAHQLKGLGLSAALEAMIVIGGTALACVVSYELVRRIGMLRPLFGLRAASAPPHGPGPRPGRAIEAES